MMTPIIRQDMVLYPGMPVGRMPPAKRSQMPSRQRSALRAHSALDIMNRDAQKAQTSTKDRAVSVDNLAAAARHQRRVHGRQRKTTLVSITEGTEMNFSVSDSGVTSAGEDATNNNASGGKDSLKSWIMRHLGRKDSKKEARELLADEDKDNSNKS